MTSLELNKLIKELTDLRLPHKLKQYRQLQVRIKSFTEQIEQSKIDALHKQLDDAVLCGVSQCFICGNDNASSTSSVASSFPVGQASTNLYNRSLSARSTVRHHPTVNTSGYLYNSQTSWHGGFASSTGSASPQPDSIDSESSTVSLTTLSGDCTNNTVANHSVLKDQSLDKAINRDGNNIVEITTAYGKTFMNDKKVEDAKNEKENVKEKQEETITDTDTDADTDTKADTKADTNTAVTADAAVSIDGDNNDDDDKEQEKMIKIQNAISKKNNTPTTIEQSVMFNKLPLVNSGSTNNRVSKFAGPPPPPVSPKPARKTMIISSPTPASIVIGNNKGSYKAYKDFIANYSKAAKE